jgi:hypothetical protein
MALVERHQPDTSMQHHPLPRPTRRRHVVSVATVIAIPIVVAACEVDVTPPRWGTRWVVPAENAVIGVSAFLPSDISVATGGTELLVGVTSDAISQSLAALCPACVTQNGTTAPKPAFTATIEAITTFPADVDSVTLARGLIEVGVANATAFDPIRPSAAAGAQRGSLTVTVRSGGTVIASRTISGNAKALPPGATLIDTVTFDPAILPRAVGSPVRTEVVINSPAGDPVAINAAQTLTVTVGRANVAVNAVKMRVQGRSISSAPVPLDLTDLDPALTSRVTSGTLLLAIDNPFTVEGTITVTISSAGTSVARPIAIVPGHSEPTISFTGEELRALLGSPPVTLRVSGAVTAVPAGGTVTVLPGMTLAVQSRLELMLASEGGSGGQ